MKTAAGTVCGTGWSAPPRGLLEKPLEMASICCCACLAALVCSALAAFVDSLLGSGASCLRKLAARLHTIDLEAGPKLEKLRWFQSASTVCVMRSISEMYTMWQLR